MSANNTVVLIGRATADPRFGQAGGADKASWTLAVDGRRKDYTTFVNITAWRKLAETVSQYVKKGMMMAVVGELSIRSYEKDGQRRYMTEVVADDVRFLTWPEQKEEEQKLTEDDDWDIPFADN